ncbi:MAG TPA: preprotein translocase subunit SecG [Candidatus Krumholzibacteria bacterium]|nr:preprotein translocase subunit SecG [Candidatus Krumholzibacteria bacterium]HRX50309.1 preprotein translocase subunit SecG [Candidatus Krumholzibacteria bacterium]
MTILFTFLHVVISLLLVVVVLMQNSKGGGLSGAFGGGGGLPQQMFGSRGMSTALHKATIYLAVGFFLTSAVLFILTADRAGNSSVIRDALQDGTLTSDITLPAEGGLLDGDVQAPAAADDGAQQQQDAGDGAQQH